MVLISYKYRFIYIKNKRVAGTSVERFFENICKGSECLVTNTHRRLDRIRLVDIKYYFIFCVVRNPWDKMISYYCMNGCGSFKDFCKRHHCSNMHRYCIDGKIKCNFFIRFENLKEDIVKVCQMLGINDYDINDLPHINNSHRKEHYSTYYDKECKKLVEKAHQNEIDYFHYCFD